MNLPSDLSFRTTPARGTQGRVANPYRYLEKSAFTKAFMAELHYPRRPQFYALSAFARRIVQLCPPGSVVVDAGAGEARWGKLFGDCEYIAFDRGVGDDSWNYTELDIIADACAIPLRDKSAHAVVAMALLGHLPRAVDFLTEVRRVLSSGGYFFALSEFAKAEHQAPFDFQRLTRFGLKDVLERAGFVDLEIRGSNGFFVSLLNLFESWIWKTSGKDANALARLLGQAVVKGRLVELLYPRRDGSTARHDDLFPVYFLVSARVPQSAAHRA